MSGSARSLSISMFAGIRIASTVFTPEYSKNGVNISAKLVANSFMNIASKANDGAGRNESISFTIWGKLAHICAKSMSPGKEWNTISQLHVYNGRVFYPGINNQPGLPVLCPDGQPLTTKKFSFTVSMLTFGEESNKHIANELQTVINGAPLRPMDWNTAGSPGFVQWRETLKARMGIQFDPNLPTYGYAHVRMPQGVGIGAYIQNAPAAGMAVAPVHEATPAAVAATFAGANPAVATQVIHPATPTAPVYAAAAPVAAPVAVNPGGFIVPGV